MSVLAFDFYAENDPNGTLLGTLDESDCKAMEFRVGLHELGSGRFTISRHHASASLVAENRLVKVRIPSVSASPIFAFWLKEGNFTLLHSDEQGGEDLTFGGPGVMYILALARLYHSSQVYDQPARGSLDRPGLWTWINEPYGAILTRIIEEGRENPFPDAAVVGSALEDVTIDFDRTTDSDSVAWPTITEEYEERIGTDMLQVAERLREAGDLYLIMEPDLSFHTHQSYGRNLTGAFGAGTVRFEAGVNILTALERELRAREDLTHLLLEDSEGSYSTEVIAGYTSAQRKHWGYFSASQTNDDTLLNAIGADVLRRSRTALESLALEITPGFAPASGRYMPGPAGTSGHFWIGDTVTLHTGTGTHDYNAEPQLVTAIRVVLGIADDSTSDTAARSLHVVPELNFEAVRSARWNDGAPGGGPSTHKHGPNPELCRPGTPSTVTTLYDRTWDEPAYDANPYVVSSDFDVSHGGSRFVNIGSATPDGFPGNSPWGINETIAVAPGQVVDVYLEAAKRDPGGSSDECGIQFRNASGGVLATHPLKTGGWANATWYELAGQFTAPANTAKATIYFTAVLDGWYLDRVLLTTAGTSGTPGDGHPDLVGTSIRATRCDHRHDVHRDRAPLATDDESEGYKLGTIWAQLDNLAAPTAIIGTWMLVDATDGAAVWAPFAAAVEDPPAAASLSVQQAFHGRFLFASHRDDNKFPITLSSDDGISWTELGQIAAYAGRDPTIVHWDGKFWASHTENGQRFPIYSSPDGETWTFVAWVTVTGITGLQGAWAPEWFVDDDGSVYLFFCATTNADLLNGFQIYAIQPSNRAMSAFGSATAVTGTGLPASMLDPFVVKKDGTYHLWYKHNTEERIEYASSASLLTGYTVTQADDWAGWGTQKEAPCLVEMDDGRWRIYFNQYSGLDSVAEYYSESTDDWATWSAAVALSVSPEIAHGTVIRSRGVYDHERAENPHPQYLTPTEHAAADHTASVEAAGYWSPLTNGSTSSPELVFASGDTITVWTET